MQINPNLTILIDLSQYISFSFLEVNQDQEDIPEILGAGFTLLFLPFSVGNFIILLRLRETETRTISPFAAISHAPYPPLPCFIRCALEERFKSISKTRLVKEYWEKIARQMF